MRSVALLAASALALTCAGPTLGQADELPRRGFFGVALGAGEGGVAVTSVLPDSTAADAGIAAGDIIQAIDGAVMADPNQVVAAMSAHDGGDAVEIELLRDGEPLALSTTLRAMPMEEMAGATLDYGSVVGADGVRLRTITSVPTEADGPFPAVMLLQGGGCGSIDTPTIAIHLTQQGLLHVAGAQGFVTMRVEKSGVGDSDGPPCAEIGYTEELAGYQAALAALRTHPAVDPDRIFLLGVSLGGVFAPILAGETPVAGIVTYGTISFAPSPYPGRSERFFTEFAGVDVLGAWARVDVHVLLMRGEFDENVQADWQVAIAEAVNAAHPGRAEHRELAGLDHCWTRHASREESVGRCALGEPTIEVADAMLAFLKEHS